jgi:prepilin-type N-terminal cleavage/methylation domain-containing protein
MQKSCGSQAGFSALEMMIAVSIVGIALMLTMKGTALLEPMRAFMTANQMTRYQDIVNTYRAQYRALPGDDRAAPTRWGRPPSVFILNNIPASFSGDDVLQGLLSDEANAAAEQFNAWRDLRFAGLIEGDKELVGRSAMPENAFGGQYGFAEDNLGLRQVLCATQIPGGAAAAIDKRLDDSNVSTGNVRGTSQWDPLEAKNHFEAPDTAPYDPEKTYIICIPFLP